MDKIRTGITRLTTGQCSRIAGGDPGMVLAGSGDGNGGAGMALAGMGVGYAGGPMAVVTIGLPAAPPLGDFDKWLIGAVGGASGVAATAFVGAMVEGAGMGSVLGPAGAVAGLVVGGLVYAGATRLIQHGNNETKYAGRVRLALP